MFENNWGNPLLTPPQTIPGPSNPWLTCTGGSGGGGGTGAGGGRGLPVPEFPETDAAGFGNPLVDRIVFIGGGAMVIQGISLIGLGAASLIFAAGALNPVGGFIAIGIFAIVVGAIAMGAGIAAMLAAIDPPVLDFASRVEPRPRRKLSVPLGTPRELVDMAHIAVELERLASGEVDLMNRVQAASSANDGASYDMHMRDLFTVQALKQEFAAKLTAAMMVFADKYADMMGKTELPKLGPLRDLTTYATDIRPQIEQIGISSSELNMVLAMTSLPSPSMAVCEGVFADLYRNSKTGADLVRNAAKEFEGQEYIKWDMFGGKPKEE